MLETKLTKCYNSIFTKHTMRFKKNRHFINKQMTPAILKYTIYENRLYKNMILNKISDNYKNKTKNMFIFIHNMKKKKKRVNICFM